jgi:1-acyl-sn-glycerol-3-phosphate acyltransferase
MLASRNGVQIVAAGITGTEKIRGFIWLIRRPRVTVTFGKPFSFPPVSGRLHKAELAQRADTIMMHIAELLPREYQGTYAR